MPNDDLKALMEAASERAKKTADNNSGANEELEGIKGQASQLEKIFSDLKLTDAAVYQRLLQVVEEATKRNESIAGVVDRLKALGAAGKKLAGQIADVASGGAIGILRTALKLPA